MRSLLCIFIIFSGLRTLPAQTATPVANPDLPQIQTAVEALGATTWPERDVAQKTLLLLAEKDSEAVLEACISAHVNSGDPEIEHRTLRIMREVVVNQVFHSRRGYLGVRLSRQREPISANGQIYFPIIVEQVMPNTAAQASGIRNGDKIIRVDASACTTGFGVTEMVNYISGREPGSTLNLTLWSAGKEAQKKVILRQRPSFPSDPSPEHQKKEFFEQWYRKKLSEKRNQQGIHAPPAG